MPFERLRKAGQQGIKPEWFDQDRIVLFRLDDGLAAAGHQNNRQIRLTPLDLLRHFLTAHLGHRSIRDDHIPVPRLV